MLVWNGLRGLRRGDNRHLSPLSLLSTFEFALLALTLNLLNSARFPARTQALLALLGSITLWTGAFNLLDLYIVPNAAAYDFACVAVGLLLLVGTSSVLGLTGTLRRFALFDLLRADLSHSGLTESFLSAVG